MIHSDVKTISSPSGITVSVYQLLLRRRKNDQIGGTAHLPTDAEVIISEPSPVAPVRHLSGSKPVSVTRLTSRELAPQASPRPCSPNEDQPVRVHESAVE